jgi:hypothetical protein
MTQTNDRHGTLLSRIRIPLMIGIVFSLFTCIDPYNPKLEGSYSLLVVDGLITDANTSYTVILSRTFQEVTAIPEKVAGARVSITDDAGSEASLYFVGNGKYKTDSTQFRAMVGKSYILHVQTADGEEYESESSLMLPVPDIESVSYEKDQELVNNGSEINDGLRIFVNTEGNAESQYYRWSFEETWKFKIPFPKRFEYININTIVPVKNVREYCWKTHKSDGISIYHEMSGSNSTVRKIPVNFIASSRSDRLMSEYSILVKQYSVSGKEYEFWNNLKQINDRAGDIFASQPYTVAGNMHNIKNPDEKVLGYFQVSAVKEKRLFIPFREVVRLGLPFYYSHDCERIEKAPSEYSTPYGPPVTFDDLYAMFCITSNYSFIEASYNEDTHQIDKLVFAKPQCANCELTGFSEKPAYWIDMK